MTSQTLRWSQESYGLKEFAECFRYQLPLVVKVTQGYCGIDESKYTFCMDDMYHISHINSQRRIVTKDSTGRMLSIPETYPVKFKRKRSGAAPQRFLEMFQELPFEPGIRVTPAEKTKLSFFIGADKQMKTGIAALELVDRFEDQYLVGNPVINGTMYEPAVDIPLFIGIKIVLAEGLKAGQKGDYTEIMEKYMAEAKKFKNETVTGNPEIMLYENNQETGGEYAYLEPKTYISCDELKALRNMYQPLLPTSTAAGSTSDDQPTNTHYQEVSYDETVKGKVKPNVPRKPARASQALDDKSESQPAGNVYHYVSYDCNTDRRSKPNPAKKPVRSNEMSHDRSSAANENYSTEKAVPHTGQVNQQTDITSNTCFETLDSVPDDLQGITTQGVADCLKLIGMGKYCENFIENDIDGELLVELDLSILIDDLGMTKLEAKKLHMFVHEKWRPKK